MASTASPSNASSSTAPLDDVRQQAGPLPLKRGEIGFQEDLHTGSEASSSSSTLGESPLPARHPADRDASSSTSQPTDVPAEPIPSAPPAADSSSTRSTKKKKIIVYLKSKKVSYLGVQLSTLLAFLIQVLLISGSIIAWVFAVRSIDASHSKQSDNTDDNSDANSNTGSTLGPSADIFIHVVFGIATLTQIILLERRIFRLRAERYSYLHPGEILPSARRRGLIDTSIAMSPWNRPPIPTYAAALAESGAGTGDVEDHIIAQPPPPAYGNTRGSTFLLSGYLSETLRAQRPTSQHTVASHMSQVPSRPLTYVSRDEGWEEIQDADRALRLEQTLARLERPEEAVTRH